MADIEKKSHWTKGYNPWFRHFGKENGIGSNFICGKCTTRHTKWHKNYCHSTFLGQVISNQSKRPISRKNRTGRKAIIHGLAILGRKWNCLKFYMWIQHA